MSIWIPTIDLDVNLWCIILGICRTRPVAQVCPQCTHRELPRLRKREYFTSQDSIPGPGPAGQVPRVRKSCFSNIIDVTL